MGDSAKFKRFGDDDRLPDGGYNAADEFDPAFAKGASTPGASGTTVTPDAPGSRRLKPGTVLTPNPDAAGPSAEPGKGA